MAKKYKAVRGTHDILPDEACRWQFVESTTRRIFSLYGFREIRTPIIESTELFARSVGESTDIVSKEMYTFDRGDESMTLRPENTASVVRAVVEHSLHRNITSGLGKTQTCVMHCSIAFIRKNECPVSGVHLP